ncbi:hypothetical protein HYH03_007295 [Edaphochlamys debaryana]|uniref:Uncharacterized protein n=1 Tax=Edaphochlamys debaryana TaxID=47281 RepID=A0A835Y4F0_9CHLO|nr:hypothetical protein HYH03_007295 [Edaphochlamys debaryana]|eukprot:KAG2494528.1 hypothetical protein HYH03_007295 [Edaphochlamys debaryana]
MDPRLAALEPPAPSGASQLMFMASRSLNRSIGVRRRTSEGGSQDGRGQPTPEEEAAEKEPDLLKEQFEREKANNPLIARVTNPDGHFSDRPSRQQMTKRPSVGFALGEEGGPGAGAAESEPGEYNPLSQAGADGAGASQDRQQGAGGAADPAVAGSGAG